MYGNHPTRKKSDHDDGTLQVRSVFLTVQGEGPYSGQRAVFVRLTGCHLHCSFCDTEWSDAADPVLTEREIYDRAAALWGPRSPARRPLMVLTGGEPTLQPIDMLVGRFTDNGWSVQIETAGTHWRDCMLDEDVHTVVSPKTPYVHPKVAAHADTYKYVIRASDPFDLDDGLPIGSTQRVLADTPARLARPRKGMQVYLTPCDEDDPDINYANHRAVLARAVRYNYIAQVQIHKLLGAA